jgi:hypothetical protein
LRIKTRRIEAEKPGFRKVWRASPLSLTFDSHADCVVGETAGQQCVHVRTVCIGQDHWERHQSMLSALLSVHKILKNQIATNFMRISSVKNPNFACMA